MKATSGLPCLYVKTFVSNKQIAMPAKKWQPLAAALKEESGSSLLGKELLAQVCSIVGRMGDNGPAAGHAEGVVKGHVFAQCVVDAAAGERFWLVKSPLVRDTAAEYLITQIATHSLAMEQTWLEHPELHNNRGKKHKGEQLWEAYDEYVAVDQCCKMLHAPIVGRFNPRQMHLEGEWHAG